MICFSLGTVIVVSLFYSLIACRWIRLVWIDDADPNLPWLKKEQKEAQRRAREEERARREFWGV